MVTTLPKARLRGPNLSTTGHPDSLKALNMKNSPMKITLRITHIPEKPDLAQFGLRGVGMECWEGDVVSEPTEKWGSRAVLKFPGMIGRAAKREWVVESCTKYLAHFGFKKSQIIVIDREQGEE